MAPSSMTYAHLQQQQQQQSRQRHQQSEQLQQQQQYEKSTERGREREGDVGKHNERQKLKRQLQFGHVPCVNKHVPHLF